MHTIASVSSAGGAANYFAKDDYYLGDGPSEFSEWGGKGAEALGLQGEVTKSAFENLLNGKLPDGTIVNTNESRRSGVDLTFSLSKSASVLALVTGDKRILEAHQQAVKQTMAWVESKFAEARDYSRNRNGEAVRTGNLVYAMFQHDTSRKLDPQSHIHVVVAAVTQSAEGKWKALWNGELWKNNSVIGSAYHAFARAALEKIGYETEITGKHGQFEIKGVPKEVIQEFSQRRQDILDKAAELGRGANETEALREITKRTRDPKLNADDKDVLRATWQQRASDRGFDGDRLVSQAQSRSEDRPEGKIRSAVRLQNLLGTVREVVGPYVRVSDPLTTNGLGRLSLTPSELRAEMAVASAIRIHGQREAAFAIDAIGKTALDLGLKGVTIDKIDVRVAQLLESRHLIPGVSDRLDKVVSHVTTPEHLQQERNLLAEIDRGRGAVEPIVPASEAAPRLQQAAGERPLNGEQMGAATLALSTRDRIVVIQGVAGAGKTTMIETIAGVAREEGKSVLGLSVANKMVGMLRDEAGIEAQTVSSFVNAHLRGALAGRGPQFDSSREALSGKVLMLDEASLVANDAMNNLAVIANKLGVERLLLIGDRAQLQAIDAGKAFSLVQSHDPAMARLDTSLRQQTEHMKQVATLTREGNFREAFQVLGDRIKQAGKEESHVAMAASKWLALPAEERAGTALYASGRASRAELNKLVQQGLKDEGTIKGEGKAVNTLLDVNATREELRYNHTYRAGQVLDVVRNSQPGGLDRGRYQVIAPRADGKVILRDADGRQMIFDPSKIAPTDKRDAIKLSERDRITLHEGDRIRWTATDKDRGLHNSDQAKVLSVDEHAIRVQNAKGDVIDLKPGDKMLERLGLSYAINMHQAQGMTTDKGIGVMHSSERHLSNQRLTHVMATRVRYDIEIVTNDKDRLLKAIERNPGDKTSALETIGEKSIDAKGGTRAAPEGNAKLPDTLRLDPDKLPGMSTGSMRSVPQLELPERNIERSR